MTLGHVLSVAGGAFGIALLVCVVAIIVDAREWARQRNVMIVREQERARCIGILMRDLESCDSCDGPDGTRPLCARCLFAREVRDEMKGTS